MSDAIQHLEALMAKAPPGPWKREGDYTVASVPAPGLHVANCRSHQDGRLDYENSDSATALIVALRNAAPHLLAVVREAEAALAMDEVSWAVAQTPIELLLRKEIQDRFAPLRSAIAALKSALPGAGGDHE